MAWTKRRKHLSRADRARKRDEAEAKRRTTVVAVRATGAAVEGDGQDTNRAVPLRRDVTHYVAKLDRGVNKSSRERYASILESVLRLRPGLVDPPYGRGLLLLAHVPWLRDPSLWRPRGRGLGAAYISLAEHLHAEFRVSRHLWESQLLSGFVNRRETLNLRFVIHVAQGRRARDVVGTKLLPARLTRRMLHLLLDSQEPGEFVELVRRAQVIAGGGNDGLARELCRSHLAHFSEQEEYWATVIAWLCRQGQVERDDLEDLLDYLGTQLDQREPVVLKGRTVRSILRERQRYQCAVRESERAWLKQRRKGRTAEESDAPVAPPCDIADYSDGDWRISRIRTPLKLIKEGAAMRHCVGSYACEQKEGSQAFWSLTRGGKRLLTISVFRQRREIANIAGRTNRDARPLEVPHILSWADANGVEASEWLAYWNRCRSGAGSEI